MSGRKRNPYPFIPKHAYNWKKVMDITNGLGIAPFKKFDKLKMKLVFVEYEEYKSNVPKPLKRLNSPFAPDEVADMLGLEDSKHLYEWLEYTKPLITEQNHLEEEIKDFLEEEAQQEKSKKRFFTKV
jgi:hypothetical protein